MEKYTLVSVKGNKTLVCDLQHAISVAIGFEAELMPAYGVQIENADGDTVAHIEDGVNCCETYDQPAI